MWFELFNPLWPNAFNAWYIYLHVSSSINYHGYHPNRGWFIIDMYTNIYYIIPYTEDTPPKTNGWTMMFIIPKWKSESHFPNLQIFGVPAVSSSGVKNFGFSQNRWFSLLPFAFASGPGGGGKRDLSDIAGRRLRGDLDPRGHQNSNQSIEQMKKEPLVVWGIYGGLYYPNIWEL